VSVLIVGNAYSKSTPACIEYPFGTVFGQLRALLQTPLANVLDQSFAAIFGQLNKYLLTLFVNLFQRALATIFCQQRFIGLQLSSHKRCHDQSGVNQTAGWEGDHDAFLQVIGLFTGQAITSPWLLTGLAKANCSLPLGGTLRVTMHMSQPVDLDADDWLSRSIRPTVKVTVVIINIRNDRYLIK